MITAHLLRKGRIDYSDVFAAWPEGGLVGVEHLAREMVDELIDFVTQADLARWTETEFHMFRNEVVDLIDDLIASDIEGGADAPSQVDVWEIGDAITRILVHRDRIELGDLALIWPERFDSTGTVSIDGRFVDRLNAVVPQTPIRTDRGRSPV